MFHSRSIVKNYINLSLWWPFSSFNTGTPRWILCEHRVIMKDEENHRINQYCMLCIWHESWPSWLVTSAINMRKLFILFLARVQPGLLFHGFSNIWVITNNTVCYFSDPGWSLLIGAVRENTQSNESNKINFAISWVMSPPWSVMRSIILRILSQFHIQECSVHCVKHGTTCHVNIILCALLPGGSTRKIPLF